MTCIIRPGIVPANAYVLVFGCLPDSDVLKYSTKCVLIKSLQYLNLKRAFTNMVLFTGYGRL